MYFYQISKSYKHLLGEKSNKNMLLWVLGHVFVFILPLQYKSAAVLESFVRRQRAEAQYHLT